MALLLSVITSLNFICIAFASDISPLQDLCPADLTSKERVNGMPCKDPATVQVNDFLFRGFHLPAGNLRFGPIAFKFVDVNTLPGLNTQGLSLARFDLAKNASILPHYHPRASEVIWVYSGSVQAGFVSFGKQYNTILNVGDVYLFPNALVHYFRNVADGDSVVMAVFNSQNPGLGLFPPRIYGGWF